MPCVCIFFLTRSWLEESDAAPVKSVRFIARKFALWMPCLGNSLYHDHESPSDSFSCENKKNYPMFAKNPELVDFQFYEVKGVVCPPSTTSWNRKGFRRHKMKVSGQHHPQAVPLVPLSGWSTRAIRGWGGFGVCVGVTARRTTLRYRESNLHLRRRILLGIFMKIRR